MKKVLITGANSYVGINVEKWLMKEPKNFHVETLDMRDPNWKKFDFSKFDVVIHVAGIAHIKEKKKNSDLYYRVNRDLAYETAKICKNNNIKHFIFMSSMSVYGKDIGIINSKSLLKPKSAYGRSKLEAEKLILALENISFKVAILRPPVIYGINSPGNFTKLIKFCTKYRVFPLLNNKRSMLFIDNFCIIIKNVIIQKEQGYIYPQNINPGSVNTIAKLFMSRRIMTLSFLITIPVLIMRRYFSPLKSLFCDLYYDNEIVYKRDDLLFVSFEKSLQVIYQAGLNG